MSKLTDPNHDLWDICCGHDLVCILSLGLHKALGTNNSNIVKPEVIEKSLRLAYEAVYFFATQLYESLKVWEKSNASFRIFPTS